MPQPVASCSLWSGCPAPWLYVHTHGHTRTRTLKMPTLLVLFDPKEMFDCCLFPLLLRQDARRIPAAGFSPLTAVRAFHACVSSVQTELNLTNPKLLLPLQSMNDSNRDVSHPQAKKKRVSTASLLHHLFVPAPLRTFACVCAATQCFIDKGGGCGYAKLAALVLVYLPVCPALLSVTPGLTPFSSAEAQLSTQLCVDL